jgi:hypothetical protein
MPSKVIAVLDQIEAEQRQELLPRHLRALELLQMTYRGELQPTSVQLRAAIEALPYEMPKLAAVAVGHLTGEDFCNRLERAINRSNKVRLIEGKVVEDEDAGE